MKKSSFLIFFAVMVAMLCPAVTMAETSNAADANAMQLQSTFQSQNVYTSQGGEMPRSFPIGNQTNFPAPASYWGTILADGRFQPLADFLSHQNAWTRAEAESLAKQKGGKVEKVVPRNHPNDRKPSRLLTFLSTKPQNQEESAKFNANFKLIKPASFFGKNGAVTAKVFGTAVLEGLDCGADLITFSEGFSLELYARSIGIGLQNSLSVVNGGTSGAGVGGVSGGGFGVTWASARYGSLPFIRVNYYARINNGGYVPPPVAAAPQAEKNNDGTLYRPEYESPPDLQTKTNSTIKKNEGGKKLSPAVIPTAPQKP